jgi:hypothetical protein
MQAPVAAVAGIRPRCPGGPARASDERPTAGAGTSALQVGRAMAQQHRRAARGVGSISTSSLRARQEEEEGCAQQYQQQRQQYHPPPPQVSGAPPQWNSCGVGRASSAVSQDPPAGPPPVPPAGEHPVDCGHHARSAPSLSASVPLSVSLSPPSAAEPSEPSRVGPAADPKLLPPPACWPCVDARWLRADTFEDPPTIGLTGMRRGAFPCSFTGEQWQKLQGIKQLLASLGDLLEAEYVPYFLFGGTLLSLSPCVYPSAPPPPPSLSDSVRTCRHVAWRISARRCHSVGR